MAAAFLRLCTADSCAMRNLSTDEKYFLLYYLSVSHTIVVDFGDKSNTLYQSGGWRFQVD